MLGIRSLAFVVLSVCAVGGGWATEDVSASDMVTGPTQMVVRVTGYCNCGTCCGWRRSWFGFGPPVFAQGPLKGRRKQVGVTARGTRAKTGTIAADPSFFPFGTRLRIPGYGEGIVEDVGGSIQGRHIDVWFPSHEEARKWGTRDLTVDVKLDAKLENSSSSRQG